MTSEFGDEKLKSVPLSKKTQEFPEKKQNIDLTETQLVAIEIAGKDANIWEKREPRFNERLTNSVKKLFGADIPPSATVGDDLKEVIDGIADTVCHKL